MMSERMCHCGTFNLTVYNRRDNSYLDTSGFIHTKATCPDIPLTALTAEHDKYRDACERLITTGANLVKVIEAATVIETMFVMGNRKDKAFQEVEQVVGAKNLLKWQLADADDFARQVKAELEAE